MRTHLTVRIDPLIIRQALELAAAENRSLAQVVEMLLGEALAARSRKFAQRTIDPPTVAVPPVHLFRDAARVKSVRPVAIQTEDEQHYVRDEYSQE